MGTVKYLLAIGLFVIFMVVFMFYTEIKHERRFPWFSTVVFVLLLTFIATIALH